MAKQITIAAILAICISLVLTLAPQPAQGQAVYGSILGTVTDPQGAAVVNAKVTVINQNKGTTDTVTTNESGNYSATHLVPDLYTVRVESAGFKISERKNVVVSADSGARVDLQFQVGGASETVEVTGEAPQLKTDRADVAVEFSSKQLGELPILNRNFQSLELLTPGTQVLTGWAHAATENPQGSKQIFVQGQHFSGTGYMLDGTDNQDPILGIIIVNPSLDTVTETKMATQNYDAEFGKATAGLMTAQTKSGSNQFHGAGYFYDLNPKGPAKDPFSGAPSPNPWKQFGGAVGGPIIKNKLFFFAGYEANRRTSGVTLRTSVPTALVRSTCLAPPSETNTYCDLSEYSNADYGGGAGVVFNPYQPAGSRQSYTEGSPGSYSTQIPFADLQQWDPNGVAEHILSLLPAPNDPGDHLGTLNNYHASGSGSFNDYQYTTRIDYNATQKMQIFGRYTHASFKLSGSPVFGNQIGGPGLGYLGLAGQSLINNYSLATGFNYTLSNTVLTDFRFGYFRYNPHSTKWDQGNATAASDLGLVGLNFSSDATTNGLPALFFDQSIGSLGEGLNVSRCNCPLIEKEQGYQFANNWTKMFGNHQFKVGADLRHALNLRVPSDANRTGELNFNHAGTSDNNTGGLDIATFLFAEVSNFGRYVGSPGEPNATETQNRFFIYAQDTWRVTHKLTVNYGLRWEYYSPEAVNAKGNGGFAVLPEGVIRVAGYGGISMTGNTAANYKNFAPRLGVAYQVDPKTVVRLGYGRSFDIGVFGSNFGHTVTQNLPVLANQSLQSLTFDNKTPAFNFTGQCLPAPNDTICGPADPATAFPVVPANGILPLFGPSNNVSPHLRPDKVVVPTVDAWNVTVQRQLTSKTTVELAYIGSHGSHVFKGNGPSYNINQATVVGFPDLTYSERSPYNTAFSTDYTDANGVTTTIVCCGGNGLGYNGNDGTNSYKALQIKVNQQATNGLSILAHYTYSRAYDNDGGYQPDQRVQWGRQDYNRDNVFVFTSLYDLPFGKGKRYLGGIGRAADLLLGGWQWNTAITISSGLPWSPSYNNCGFDRDTGPCRPSLIGSFHMGAGKFDPQTKQVPYFTPTTPQLCDSTAQNQDGSYVCHDPDDKFTQLLVTESGAFGAPGVAKFGNIRRNQFTGPGAFKADMSIYKNFTITERVKAQFQAQFFNVFNHPVYNLPNNCIDCSGSGTITSLEGQFTMRQFQMGFRATF
ncbi:MAG: TonB-dependent receptor [Acidobacteriales bacterium]|nr:TonB-dependent receptor [Candidatus Koribacter versatilis]MBI3646689.1 TonB-dependent receptor [Terriglobales bacterium]